MKGMRYSLVFASLFVLGSTSALAGTAEVKWKDVDSFTDIRSSTSNQDKFEERVLNELAEHFNELAASLADDYQWKVTIVNLDLAGHIDMASSSAGEFTRIVRDIHFPKINFDYELVDGSGNVIKAESVEIKDMQFNSGPGKSMRKRNEFLYFEKQMIDDWFNGDAGLGRAS